MHLGDDYIGIKAWLVKHYGDASRIVNNTIASLSKKKKPNPTNKKDRYTFYSDIVIALLRLERLTNDKLVDNVLLNECLYSRSTLHILISLLPQADYTELKRELTRRDIDFNNPVGVLTFTCFKDFCTIERNAMEGTQPNPSHGIFQDYNSHVPWIITSMNSPPAPSSLHCVPRKGGRKFRKNGFAGLA